MEGTVSEEREALQELIAEAHRVMKDLTHLLRDVRKAEDSLRDAVEDELTKNLSTQVDGITASYLATYGNAIMEAIDGATKEVHTRFELLADILVGETKTNKRTGRSLEDTVRDALKVTGEKDDEDVEAVRRILRDRGWGDG